MAIPILAAAATGLARLATSPTTVNAARNLASKWTGRYGYGAFSKPVKNFAAITAADAAKGFGEEAVEDAVNYAADTDINIPEVTPGSNAGASAYNAIADYFNNNNNNNNNNNMDKNGLAGMFTLSDGVKLIQAAKDKEKYDPVNIKMREALLGGYLHTDDTAEKKAELIKTKSKQHGRDNPEGVDSITGKPGGKLPNHISFSTQSPYYIKGITPGGTWSKDGNNSYYQVDAKQFADKNYMNGLAKYFNSSSENGVLVAPDGTFIVPPKGDQYFKGK